MGYARKNLPAVDDTLELDDSVEKNGIVSLQYLDGSAGTVVLEGTNTESGNAADNVAANWHILTMKKTDNTDITSLAAAGIGYAENYYNRVRARKTVGVAACNVILGVTYG